MRIGIVGATGVVGRMMLQVMEETNIPIQELELFSSHKSAGSSLKFRERDYCVKELTVKAMQGSYDYLLFSAGSKVSLEYAPIAEAAGNTVIDNSSAFRKTHPLIVPEINASSLKNYRGIIANPNCSTIQLVLVLDPLNERYELEEIVVSTYQSVSGAGYDGIAALNAERENKNRKSPFAREIEMNVIPQIGAFNEQGECEEEQKMIFEIKKIINNPGLRVAVTTVRVPVLYGHAETVFARFRRKICLAELSDIFRQYPAIEYHGKTYITPKEIGDSDKSHIARIRKGVDDYSLLFWNVAHNVRLGAATNAINIMRYLIKSRETSKET